MSDLEGTFYSPYTALGSHLEQETMNVSQAEVYVLEKKIVYT